MWLEALNKFKRESKKTAEQISIESGVPRGTLNKLFAGQTKDPQYQTLKAVVNCLGHTIDELEEPLDASLYSSKEQNIIKKYRALDERGKQTVENTLNHEYELISRDEQEKQEEDEDPLYIDYAALGGNGVQQRRISKEEEKEIDEIVKNIKGIDKL